ncbi:dynamin family protein [Sulfurivermis fontis]|uniref:dynamin family protein n=1 Tax=Sulfurivermis fontis TaxID=1972068 RepID=UPI000FDCB71E|nr:dynamin family protein [Sulfurivermis fontis]
MANQRFDRQMQAYGQWKTALLDGIQRYQRWLDSNKMGEAEDELRIYEVLEALRADRLTIAFVAEFARGKTELINAIFFSEYDRRLLPSEAGRTTMCPTELFWDNSVDKAYVRLLPIETRLTDTPIAEYKLEPVNWTHIELDLTSPDNMAEAFQEIVKVKQVPLDEARKLGLYSDADAHMHMKNGKMPDKIDIPMWRHALISFPHPLLKQGLVILDTPGLNALGSEPELTLNMLPNAQAVVFVLAADTGVTKSDLEMWQHNVKPLRSGHKKGLFVVLNKVDTLWDELKTPEHIAKTVADQCQRAAQTLGIEADQIYPASAQKGLLAKIRHDKDLLARSNILALENILAGEVLPYKQSLVREHILTSIGSMVKESHDILATRLASARKQLEELKGLSGKNNEVIELLMKKTRDEQVAYYKNVESFQANKRIIQEQSKKLSDTINLASLDQLVAETRKAMSDSWTTHGLKTGMKTFFDGVNARLSEVSDFADQLNRLVITIYRTFHQEHGIAEIKPALYSLTKYKQEFQQLYQEAEAFRTSPLTTMTEQHYVIKKFFISLVSHARNIFFKAQRDAESWSKAVMSPLVKQIKEHKETMEQRLENLRKINESRDTLQARIEELEKSNASLMKQYAEVRAILNTINQPLEVFEDVEPTAKAS